jgi:hypothetical protein
VRIEAHRLEHVRRLERARRARRSGRHGDALEIERDDERFGLDALEADVAGVGDAGVGPAVDVRAGHGGEEIALERVAQRGHAADLGEARPGACGGDAEADQCRDVLGAGAAVALLASAGHLRDQPRAAAHPQRAGALRAGELVPGDGEQIYAERRDVERQLAGRLHGVRVEQRTAGVGDGGELGDRLDGADLVVGVHHRHQRGAIGDQGVQGIRRDDAGSIDAEPADIPTAAGEGPRGLQDRFVFDGADHEVPPARRLERFGGAAHRENVSLGSTAGEDDLGRIDADEGRRRGARAVEPRFRALPPAVHARRVAEVLAQGAVHGVRDRRIDWRRGVVVEVDRHGFRS